jgi:transcriptional regulator of acetoin/glycerol metabolism
MEIDVADLSISNTKHVSEMSEETDSGYTLLESVERNTIVQTLKASEGNKLEAAKRLGIGRQTLYNKLKAYGIEV